MKNYLKSLFRKGLAKGYTIVEVLVTVGLISVASAGAYYMVAGVSKDTTDTKLRRDVATINRAVGVYQASGGSLGAITDPQAVLDRLKTRMAAADAKQMAGLRGSLVDTRLKAVAQDATQAASNEPRAYWNAGTHAFYVASAGAAGVREFVLDESLAAVDYGEAARNSAFKLAKVNPWIWDTAETSAQSKQGPRTSTPTFLNPGTPTNPGDPLKLRPPVFSVDGGEYALSYYPLTLTLTNPNPPNSSNLIYTINGGDWRVYLNDLFLNPGDVVKAMAATIIPDIFSDSDMISKTYTSTPVTPEFALTFPQTSYSYLELGGSVMPANTPTSSTPVNGDLQLTNGAAIPDPYESSVYLQTKWTLDGTDPFTSGTSIPGPNFVNGFPGQQIPITLADFGANPQLVVKAAGATKNPGIFKNSAVVEATVGITVLKLRQPIIAMEERDVTLTFDYSDQDVPTDAFIMYTTDGSDPAGSGGILYTGSFKLDGAAGASVSLAAMVFPPPAYPLWFDRSDAASMTVVIPVASEFYVGGNFMLTNGVSGSGGPMRNIARLKGNGSVDTGFDVGTGATANSLVGVIRQSSAGTVFAGGDFDDVNNVARPAIVRLKTNGSVDTGFDAALAGGK